MRDRAREVEDTDAAENKAEDEKSDPVEKSEGARAGQSDRRLEESSQPCHDPRKCD